MMRQVICPSCGGGKGAPFYELEAVPINSCLLINSRSAAVDFPVAPLVLCFVPRLRLHFQRCLGARPDALFRRV